MFSFHKPKVYRSSAGCCICKAKSSSSRFTDSKKYEDDFLACFQLPEKRCGEVCNACVLLVKRWKKLPQGNGRNWRHVVDARAGPGTKSMTKFKSRNHNRPKPKRKSQDEESDEPVRKKKPKKHREPSPTNMSDEMQGEETDGSPVGSRSPTPSEDRDEVGPHKRLNSSPPVSSFIDLSIWKREKICCGTIFVGPRGAVIIDPRFVKPCRSRNSGSTTDGKSRCLSVAYPSLFSQSSSSSSTSSVSVNGIGRSSGNKSAKGFSDNSSDSGYDESSNQGAEIRERPPPPAPQALLPPPVIPAN